MATFKASKELEMVETVTSNAINGLRLHTDDKSVDAFSLQYRHPRFKSRLTRPHFYAKFKIAGQTYIEDAQSLEDLNQTLLTYPHCLTR